MRKQILIKKVLAEINAIRNEMGLNPVDYIRKGKVSNSKSCPIAKTLACCSGKTRPSLNVGDGCILFYNYNRFFETSEDIKEFIHKFDNGKLPEYEA